jgi:hypothetical protein
MGVKLPAKLVITDVNRITAAKVSFMYASIKGVEWVTLQGSVTLRRGGLIRSEIKIQRGRASAG